jgi:hypothetical protein
MGLVLVFGTFVLGLLGLGVYVFSMEDEKKKKKLQIIFPSGMSVISLR